ncbi:MAG: hypothetical protein JST68_23030 [Bacteroidetes bacterium]|nr:hypothetical protein [Bacteroidota bacterium]
MTSQSPTEQSQSLEALQDIKRMMERSSRFISLSGLSGVSAGICALIGAYIARIWIREYYDAGGYVSQHNYLRDGANSLEWKLFGLAIAVLIAALLTSTWFTWRKARRSNLPIWDHASKKLAINMAIPLGAGGLFVLGLINHSDWSYVAPTCLVFYGLALVNASKYTLTDIRYLGILEVILGIVCMYYPHEGLYFWAFGFGVLHIIYGLIMWWKYEKS